MSEWYSYPNVSSTGKQKLRWKMGAHMGAPQDEAYKYWHQSVARPTEEGDTMSSTQMATPHFVCRQRQYVRILHGLFVPTSTHEGSSAGSLQQVGSAPYWKRGHATCTFWRRLQDFKHWSLVYHLKMVSSDEFYAPHGSRYIRVTEIFLHGRLLILLEARNMPRATFKQPRISSPPDHIQRLVKCSRSAWRRKVAGLQ